VYQVVWVRKFGNVFGNTIYAASLVVAVFMEASTPAIATTAGRVLLVIDTFRE
jgi:hypothetical protein